MIPTSAELYRYSIRFKDPVTPGNTTLRTREGALIRLATENGSEGWGETTPLQGFSLENLDEAIDQLRSLVPTLVGRKIYPGELITDNAPFFESYKPASSVRFGLETALLNLYASSRKILLSELLTNHPRKAVFVNGLLSGSVNGMLADARSMGEAGYLAVKIKAGRRSVTEDVEVVRKVGEVLGENVSLRLDANRAWGFEEAVEFGRGVSGMRISYVEEPLAEAGRLPELAGAWGLPVALDESLVGMDPEALDGHRYARAIVLKPTLLGGVSRVLRFMERAKALGMAPVVSSSYEGGVGTGALVALAAVGDEPAGLDTYRALAEDVVSNPLALPAPQLDVRETVDAARRVDVRSLEPVSLT
jgi:o-succinylbenzoate synthase